MSIGNKYSFENSQSALIGLSADAGEAEGDGQLHVFADNVPGLTVNGNSILSANGTVMLLTGRIMNYADEPALFSTRACLVDRNGNVRQQIGTPVPAELGSYSYQSFTFIGQLQVQPELTDRFQLFISSSDGIWQPLSYDRNRKSLEGCVSCGIASDPLILIGDDCHVSDVVTLELGCGRMPVKSVAWSVNGQPYSDRTLTLPHGRTEIRADVVYCDDSAGSICKTLVVE